MSVGCFIGAIRSSYIDEALDSAALFVRSIDQVLKQNGLPGYSEPDGSPDVYEGGLFGRSALDHHSASCLVELAEMAKGRGNDSHIGLLATNPYRVAFLPIDFDIPMRTSYSERITGAEVEIWVGSLPRLFSELVALAPVLGIPLVQAELTDDVARQINDFAPLYAGDDCHLVED